MSPRVADSPRSPPESISSSATRPVKEIWPSVVCSWSSVRSSSLGQLGVGGRAPQLALELRVRLLERPRLGPHRARHPVDRAELVEDVPLDAGDGVGLELEAAAEVELLDGVDQPEDAVGHEVGLVDALGQAGGDATGDVLHQRRVVDDQLVALLAAALGLVLGPESLDVRFEIVAHRGHPCARHPCARGWVASYTERSRSRLT